MRYIGIDLAWNVSPPKEQGTGFCVITEQGLVAEVGLLTEDREIMDLASRGPAWIGIDASLRLPPDGRARRCEQLLRSNGLKVLPTSRDFYRRHYGGFRGESIAGELESLGYRYFGDGPRSYFEVYPYAVMKALSPAPPTYKKGPRHERKKNSEVLLRQIQEWEPSLQLPPLSMLPLVDGKGAADRMDALLAAVSLYRHRLYSGTRSLVVGEPDDGYILLPRGGRGSDR